MKMEDSKTERPASLATSAKISLQSPPKSGASLESFTKDSTEKVNALLQQNHDNLHVLWDLEDYLHNHIAHHLLAIYALGATPQNLQFAYDTNVGMQLPIGEKKPPVLQEISHSDDWGSYLGKAELYHTFMQFFQNSIDQVGWRETIKKYLFSEKGIKDGMPERLVAGFLHPWIHLGYGVEFEQPALVAEALAQTAVHDCWPSKYLKACTAAATKDPRQGSNPTIVSLFYEAHDSEKLRSSTKWSDPQKNKAVYANAFEEMVALASKWYILPTATDEVLAKAAAELASAAAFACASTPRLDKKLKFDFFIMHTVNSSVFLDVWMKQEWLGNAEKSILLNYFAWMVVNMYVSRGCADFHFEQVEGYKGKLESGKENNWEAIAERANKIEDDGHVPKMVRALMNAAKVSLPFTPGDGFEIPTKLYEKIAEMNIDAAEDCGKDEPLWVRSTGHTEAWAKVEGPRLKY
ncbi:hypothetical protein ABW20_dc0104295 [Dactylellina cionopaga]|nr:hypothetical protein ABW20_dc0104295 [Dactylellina cionopaga]